MKKDIRWKQRFQNLENAFLFLQKAVAMKEYDDLQRAGLVQSFEFTFELSWKTLKDYLNEMGMTIPYPREIIKESFKSGLIEDGHLWLKMLDKRNELSHTYNKKQAEHAVHTIQSEYYPGIAQVYHALKKIIEKSCTD